MRLAGFFLATLRLAGFFLATTFFLATVFRLAVVFFFLAGIFFLPELTNISYDTTILQRKIILLNTYTLFFYIFWFLIISLIKFTFQKVKFTKIA